MIVATLKERFGRKSVRVFRTVALVSFALVLFGPTRYQTYLARTVPPDPTAGPAADQAADQTIVLVGGTIIDGRGGAPIRNGVIVIRGNRIIQVGPHGKTPYPNRRASSI